MRLERGDYLQSWLPLPYYLVLWPSRANGSSFVNVDIALFKSMRNWDKRIWWHLIHSHFPDSAFHSNCISCTHQIKSLLCPGRYITYRLQGQYSHSITSYNPFSLTRLPSTLQFKPFYSNLLKCVCLSLICSNAFHASFIVELNGLCLQRSNHIGKGSVWSLY